MTTPDCHYSPDCFGAGKRFHVKGGSGHRIVCSRHIARAVSFYGEAVVALYPVPLCLRCNGKGEHFVSTERGSGWWNCPTLAESHTDARATLAYIESGEARGG